EELVAVARGVGVRIVGVEKDDALYVDDALFGDDLVGGVEVGEEEATAAAVAGEDRGYRLAAAEPPGKLLDNCANSLRAVVGVLLAEGRPALGGGLYNRKHDVARGI